MQLKDIIKNDMIIASENAKVSDIAKLMEENNTGVIVIVKSTKNGHTIPVGIVTEKEITFTYSQMGNISFSLVAKDLMNRNMVSSHFNDDIFLTLKKMRDVGVQRSPVVNEQGELKGIVDVEDIIPIIGIEFKNLAQIIENNIDLKKCKVREVLMSSQRPANYSGYSGMV